VGRFPGAATIFSGGSRVNFRLFAAVLAFLSASLLFSVQPHWGRRLAPSIGGGPPAWNACLVFFQAALLAGYTYALWLPRRLAGRAAVVHGAFLIAAASWLFTVSAAPPLESAASPTLDAVLASAASIGLPVFVLSATAPLLHRWGAARGVHGRGGYGVYAASNAGSLAALVAYPIAIEPNLGLDAQWAGWRMGFVAFAGLMIPFALGRSRHGLTPLGRSESIPRPADNARGSWVFWSALPSALLVSATQRITEDVAAGPMLWLPPLVAFLLASIFAFAGRSPSIDAFAWILVPLLFVRSAVLVAANLAPLLWLPFAVELFILFFASWCSFAILYSKRPADADSASFYLCLSLGGALGGGIVTLLAPRLFRSTVEHPLELLLLCLLLPTTAGSPGRTVSSWVVGVGAIVLAALGIHDGSESAAVEWLLLLGSVGMLLAMAIQRPPAFGLAMATPLALAVQFGAPRDRAVLTAVRSEFGVHRVVEFQDEDGVRYHALRHGGVVHGWQCRESSRVQEPLGYYHPTSAVGEALAFRKETGGAGDVAVIGLGAGAALVHRRTDQRFVFFEIDPAVAKIAADPRFFTYLNQTGESAEVRVGDGRLLMNRAPDGAFSTIFLDAFSGDAVPTHLLTKEAFALYRRKLKPDGAIVVNATNWFVDLEPIVANVGSSVGLSVVGKSQTGGRSPVNPGPTPTRCVVLMKDETLLARLSSRPGWRPPARHDETPLWTDDFCDLWSILRWRGL
jgi:hypothetical protein